MIPEICFQFKLNLSKFLFFEFNKKNKRIALGCKICEEEKKETRKH